MMIGQIIVPPGLPRRENDVPTLAALASVVLVSVFLLALILPPADRPVFLWGVVLGLAVRVAIKQYRNRPQR